MVTACHTYGKPMDELNLYGLYASSLCISHVFCAVINRTYFSHYACRLALSVTRALSLSLSHSTLCTMLVKAF